MIDSGVTADGIAIKTGDAVKTMIKIAGSVEADGARRRTGTKCESTRSPSLTSSEKIAVNGMTIRL